MVDLTQGPIASSGTASASGLLPSARNVSRPYSDATFDTNAFDSYHLDIYNDHYCVDQSLAFNALPFMKR